MKRKRKRLVSYGIFYFNKVCSCKYTHVRSSRGRRKVLPPWPRDSLPWVLILVSHSNEGLDTHTHTHANIEKVVLYLSLLLKQNVKTIRIMSDGFNIYLARISPYIEEKIAGQIAAFNKWPNILSFDAKLSIVQYQR